MRIRLATPVRYSVAIALGSIPVRLESWPYLVPHQATFALSTMREAVTPGAHAWSAKCPSVLVMLLQPAQWPAGHRGQVGLRGCLCGRLSAGSPNIGRHCVSPVIVTGAWPVASHRSRVRRRRRVVVT
jgi:hypothetical protein